MARAADQQDAKYPGGADGLRSEALAKEDAAPSTAAKARAFMPRSSVRRFPPRFPQPNDWLPPAKERCTPIVG